MRVCGEVGGWVLTADITVKRNFDKLDDCLTVVDSCFTPTQLCVFLVSLFFLPLQISREFSVHFKLESQCQEFE